MHRSHTHTPHTHIHHTHTHQHTHTHKTKTPHWTRMRRVMQVTQMSKVIQVLPFLAHTHTHIQHTHTQDSDETSPAFSHTQTHTYSTHAHTPTRKHTHTHTRRLPYRTRRRQGPFLADPSQDCAPVLSHPAPPVCVFVHVCVGERERACV